MGLIYLAVNTKNGYMYVGKTQETLSRRQYKHKNSSKDGKCYFHKAIRKYGWDSFSWVVIDEVPNSELPVAEKEYIAYYKMLGKHLYNLTDGGEGFTGKHTQSTKDKISKKLTGRKDSVELSYRKTRHRVKTYILVSPNGIITTITNMDAFCKQRGYDSGFMNRMIHGKKRSAYGWTLPSIGEKYE